MFQKKQKDRLTTQSQRE